MRQWWRGLDRDQKRFYVSLLLAGFAASLTVDVLNVSGFVGFLVRVILLMVFWVLIVFVLGLFWDTARQGNDDGQDSSEGSSGADLDSSPPESG